MTNIYSYDDIAKLEEGIIDFTFAPDSTRSLVNDLTFQALCTLCLTGDVDNGHQLWHKILVDQIYPDPEHFLQVNYFSERIVSSEPGMALDYRQIRKDIVAAETEIVGGRDTVAQMFAVCNELVHAHVRYVQVAANVDVFGLYGQMIDRFYSTVSDLEFDDFVTSSSAPSIFQNARWPTYETMKSWASGSLSHWQRLAKHAGQEVAELKEEKRTKWFLAKLDITLQARFETFAKQGPGLQSRSQLPYHTRRSNDTTISERQSRPLTRRQLITLRNHLAQQTRTICSRPLKTTNLDSIRQLGDSTRIPLTDSVIQAISSLQNKWTHEILPGDRDEEELEEEYAERKVIEKKMIEMGLMGNADEQICDGLVFPPGTVDWNAVQAIHAS